MVQIADQADHAPTMVQIADLLLMAQRTELQQSQQMQRNIRRARQATAPIELQRKVRLRQKWRTEFKNTTREVKELERALMEDNRLLRREQIDAYRQYVDSIKELRANHKRDTNDARTRLAKAREKKRRQRTYIHNIENALRVTPLQEWGV
jgi:hypothetical protein